MRWEDMIKKDLRRFVKDPKTGKLVPNVDKEGRSKAFKKPKPHSQREGPQTMFTYDKYSRA